MIAATPIPEDVAPALVAIALVAAIYGTFGLVCAVIAPTRGRSAVGWFFIGVFTQCIGVILVFLLPNLKLEEQKQRRRDAETRRLREMLKKERQTADERHEAHRTRLGAHDRALGVDTSSAESPLLTTSTEPPALPPATESAWYFASGGERMGPVSAARLKELWIEQQIDDEALVWRDGMGDWARITEVVDLLDDDRKKSS